MPVVSTLKWFKSSSKTKLFTVASWSRSASVGAFELDVGRQFNFIALPAFNGYGTFRSPDQRYRPP